MANALWISSLNKFYVMVKQAEYAWNIFFYSAVTAIFYSVEFPFVVSSSDFKRRISLYAGIRA